MIRLFDIAEEGLINISSSNDFRKEEYKKKNYKVCKIEMINGNKYRISKGKYYSLHFDDIKDEKTFNSISKELVSLVGEMIDDKYNKILIVGIGNDDFAPDSLGPRVVKNIKATYHLSGEKETKVACIIPGVMGVTGLESASIVKGIINENKIDCVIVIDSLATTSLERLNHVIQITDTGIKPGSGVSNYRKGINKEYLGCKVVSLGVGTVISLEALINNFASIKINNKFKDLVFTTKEIELKIDLITDLLSSSLNHLLHQSQKLTK